ncbi:SANT/Myb_domain [Hexamita inflata]|uniref:SANT/Myb_domain n=1 Tax=Hexamita inflata TaxID=28002 RepID=A0ABP1HFN4_9EUKA
MIQQAYCKWSQEEKDKLVDVVTKYKAMNQKLDWTQIQNYVGTKTVRQCYDQYVRQFKKQHKTDAKPTWTVHDRKLVKVFSHSQQIQSESVLEKEVCDRQYSKWSQKEKDKLVEQINKFITANMKPNWVDIQSCIKTKTVNAMTSLLQCSRKYTIPIRGIYGRLKKKKFLLMFSNRIRISGR